MGMIPLVLASGAGAVSHIAVGTGVMGGMIAATLLGIPLEGDREGFPRRGRKLHIALRRLSEAGIAIALDDFGPGFASLSHLNKHPVDLINIDRTFLKEVGEKSSAAPIVDANRVGPLLGE